MQNSKDLKNPLLALEITERPKIKPVSLLSLFKYSDGVDKGLMALGSLASMAGGASMPFFMIFFSQISEIFIDGNQNIAQEKGREVAIKFFILGGFTWFLNFLGIYCWSMTGKRQTLRLKKLYYKTLIEQQVAWFDSNDVNKLSTQISANMIAVETAIGEKVAFLQATLVTSIFGLFYAFFKCWQLSLILTAFLPLMLIAGVLMMKGMQMKAQLSKISYQDASGVAQQAFSAIRTIKSFVSQEFEQNKFISALSQSQKKVTKYVIYVSASLGFMTLIFLGLYSFGIWYGKQLIIWSPDVYTAPIVLSTFFCFLIGGASVGQISPLVKNLAEGKVAAGKLYYLTSRKRTLVQPEPGIQVNQLDLISFKNVTFKYEKLTNQPDMYVEASAKLQKKDVSSQSIYLPQQETSEQKMTSNDQSLTILQNLSLSFDKGKITAIVGESGSGKSTIVQLLMRYYDPINGKIFINGIDLKDVDVKGFRKKIGYVGQQPVLFSMSICQNIRLSNPDLSNQQIQQILKKANAWQFVQKCQKGLDTYVGTGGAQISGGQKQRIAIARALAKKPSILILDEATSALDRKNQKQIQKTLNNLSAGNITTIVVAHRLSTIKNANKIIVLGKGKILQQGTHNQLYQKQGAYYELVKSQMLAESNNLQVQQVIQKQQTKPEDDIQKTQQSLSNQIIGNKKNEQQKEGNRYTSQQLNSVFGKLFKESKGSYHLIFLGCLGALCNGAVWPFFNIAFSNIMSLMAQAQQKSDQINTYCLLFLIVACSGSFLTFLYTLCFNLVGQKLVFSLRKKLFSKLLLLPISYYDRPDNTPGGISTKLSQDTYQINNMITGTIGVICLNISTISLSLIFAFYYSWKLTLIVLALTPLIAISGAINMKVIKGMSQKSEKYEKSLGSMISDTVCNIRTVKSFGNQLTFRNIFASKIDQISKINSEKSLKSSFLQGFSRGSVMFVEGFTFWIAAILFANGQIDEPKAIYIAIFSIIFAAMGVGQNSQFMPDMGKAKISGACIYQILQTKDEVQQAKQIEDPSLANKIEGNIQFVNVKFKYPQRQAVVLKNFSLKINKGDKIALVGPSGSGKSTIVQILLRFYPIQEGQILIDGFDYKKYNLHAYRKNLGLVSQQPTLFLGTVQQNVIYNHKIKKQHQSKLQKYCRIAHALDFINEWPQKFRKQVGQKGSQVSGGQKQRIALARCLLREPKIVLLDQSTSALDADTEKIVFQNLKPILKQKTSISIAHRLSTIQDSNKIIVMRDGQIIQVGQYNQLMAKKQNFYRLAKGIN